MIKQELRNISGNRYYGKKYVVFNLMEQTKNREFAVLPLMRAGQLRSTDEFEKLLDLINWNSKKSSFYISCSKLRNIKNFTWNMRKRSSSTSEWFEKEFQKEVYETDFFLDFDGDDLGEVKEDVFAVKEFLDEGSIPYQIIFSGNRGFHIIIDGKYFKTEKIDNGLAYPHKQVAENLKEGLKLKTLDLSNNGLINRLRKLPYSLVLPKNFSDIPSSCQEGIMRIALPLSDKQFSNFTMEDVLLNNVMRELKLIRRGNLERFNYIGDEKKIANVNKFIGGVLFR